MCCGRLRCRRSRSVRYVGAPILQGSVDGVSLETSPIYRGPRGTRHADNMEMSVLNGNY